MGYGLTSKRGSLSASPAAPVLSGRDRRRAASAAETATIELADEPAKRSTG